MNKATQLLIIILCLFFLSCSKVEEQHTGKVEKSDDIAKDVRIPFQVWEMLDGSSEAKNKHEENKHEEKKESGGHEEKKESGGHGEKKEAGKEGESNTESLADDSYIFADIKVKLEEKNSGILRDKSIIIEFPRGGGEIDLTKYVVPGKQGTFYVVFEYPTWEDAKDKKVLFISQSKKRKIEEQIFGSGCKTIFNITDRFLVENSKGGIKVNTTRNRHISVLAGTFIFSAIKAGQKYITQVTFTDSQNMNLLCQGK